MRNFVTESEVTAFGLLLDQGLTVRQAAEIMGRSKSALHKRYLDRKTRNAMPNLEEAITKPIDKALAKLFKPETDSTTAEANKVAEIPTLKELIRRFVEGVIKTINKLKSKAA